MTCRSTRPTLANGQHTLKVVAQDAAGNSAVVYDGTISTKQPSNDSLGALPGPAPAACGKLASLTPVAVPNGTTASRTAQLISASSAGSPAPTRTARCESTGRLLDGQGHPIAGAALDVLQQVSGSPSLAVIGHAKTRANGTFTASVPGGPNRTIEIAYRAFSTDASYAATGEDR